MTLRTRLLRPIALATLALTAAGLFAQAPQSAIYKARNGVFDVTVPAGWTTEWDPKLEQVTLRHESTMAIVMGMTMPNETPAYAKTFLGMLRDDFSSQCKESTELEHGPARLASLDAQAFLLRCPKAPVSVAGSTVTWSAGKVLLSYTVVAPVRTYGDDVATLDAIGASVHLTGTPALQPAVLTEDQRVAEVKRACTAGSFAQEECARRIGQAMSASDALAVSSAAGSRFSDAENTFSVQVPAGWKATQENKNGIVGVQLRHGDDWIALMQAPAGAQSAKDVVLHFEAGFVKSTDPQPPFGAVGVVQIFGQGVEVDYDRFGSENDDHKMVDSEVAGIGDISGHGPFVLMFTSIARGTDTVSMAVAQSVRLNH